MSDWRSLVKEDILGEEIERFRLHERLGRPPGDAAFVERMEKLVCRVLRRRKPGPREKDTHNLVILSPDLLNISVYNPNLEKIAPTEV